MLDEKSIGEDIRRVAIYIRVSTAEQKMEGYGLEAQEKRLVDYVENNKALNLETKPSWIYRDTHTGSDLNRESLQRLMEDVKKGKYDAVLVWKIDRLSRSLKHLLLTFEEFEKHQVSFISVQENIDFRGPIGKLIFQIFGAIAQFERELIKGRTQMGKITSAELGNYTGTNIPFGYNKVKNKGGKGSKLTLNNEERKWVQKIYEWYVYEGLGYGQIANRLNDLKVQKKNHRRTNRASVKWTQTMVRTIIQNPLYKGAFVANRKDDMGTILPEEEWTVVEVPSCVSETLFYQAQQVAKKRKSASSGSEYLLAGKLVDMTLENPKKFVGAKRYKGGFSYRRKQFKQQDGIHVPVFEVPGLAIEEFVWGKIVQALEEPEVFIREYLSREYADPTKAEKLEHTLHSLRGRRETEELAIAKIENAYEEGTYSIEKMEAKIMERHEQLVQIDERIQETEDELHLLSDIDVEVQKLREASKQVKYRLEKLDRKQQKILCELFIDRIEMRRTKGGKKWKVQADICFRFNPNKFKTEGGGGRTSDALAKAQKGDLGRKKSLDGGRCKT